MPFAVRTVDTVMRKKQMNASLCVEMNITAFAPRSQNIRNSYHYLADSMRLWCIQCCSIDNQILCVLRGRALIYMLFPILFSVQCMTANLLICMAMAMPANCRCLTSFLLKLDSTIHSNRKFLQTKTDRKKKRNAKTTHSERRAHTAHIAFCRFARTTHVWTNFL